MSSYYELRVETLEEAIEYCETYQQLRAGVVFRGQANAVWELTANAFRGNVGPEEVEQRFRKTDAFCKWWRTKPAVPPFDDAQLWQVAQHYGMSTDLLDFTESVYVAAFFACGQPRVQVKARFERAALFLIDPVDFEKIHAFRVCQMGLDRLLRDTPRFGGRTKFPAYCAKKLSADASSAIRTERLNV